MLELREDRANNHHRSDILHQQAREQGHDFGWHELDKEEKVDSRQEAGDGNEIRLPIDHGGVDLQLRVGHQREHQKS